MGEYLRLNGGAEVGIFVKGLPYCQLASSDFVFDFKRGLVRLLPSGALMSFSQPTRAAVLAITAYGAGTAGGVPMTATELAADLGDRLVAAAEAVPSLAHHTPMPRPSLAEELGLWVPTSRERELRAPHPWEPHRSVVDNLYARSHHLATSETSMGMAVRLEALDGGTDSPPQVG